MVAVDRDSGIEVIGGVPWGTHFCFFFETRDDLVSVLVPFFEAGLKNNEYCACVTSEPLGDDAFKKAMRDAVPRFDEYLDNGQIEVIPFDEWYYDDGNFNLKKAFDGWLKKLQAALANGYDGMRVTGSISWLKRENWDEFLDYENEVNGTIGNSRMLAICTYPLDSCDAGGIVGAMSVHQFALVKQNSEFKLIENPGLKETKKALLESEEKFKNIFDHAAMGIAIPDVKGYIIDCNLAYQELLGYSKEELREKRFIEFTHPDDIDKNLELQRQLSEGLIEKYNIEKRYIRKDGRLIWVQVTASAIRNPDGSLKNNLAVVEDITERKQAEQALRESEEFNRSTLDSLPSNIAVLDGSGNIVFANKQWMMFGRENDAGPAESIGAGANYFEVCREAKGPHSDEAPAALKGMLAVLNGERDTFELEYPCHSPDKKRWFTMRIAPVMAGAFRGIIVVHTDITLNKLYEEALADEKARAELYNDLMGHDINNYNQVVLGYLELIDRMVEGEKLKELVSKPLDAIKSSSHLIDNVRKLQKARTGGLKTEPVDLDIILSELQAQYSKVPGKAVTIHYTHDPGCVVMADKLIRDVFSNLIWNGIKHSGKTSIWINLELKRHREDGKEYYRVTVEDDGPGIPDAQKEKIFSRYQRGDTKADGKGLGLYLVKTLVEGYHGRVWLEDRVKGDHTKGARFVVMLPAIEK